MMMENTELGIRIVGGIANIAVDVNQLFTYKELNTLLSLFDHFTSQNKEYLRSKPLVEKAIETYKTNGDTNTAANIQNVFVNDRVDTSLVK
jgi:hypothetical protein